LEARDIVFHMPRISLIIPSVNRTKEVIRLFDSLMGQTYRDFEVILVDQNSDDRLVPICRLFSERLHICHLRSEAMGAAQARNHGFSHSTGDVLLWPDDDSWLPPWLLQNIVQCFDAHPHFSGLIGTLVDEQGRPHTRWRLNQGRDAKIMDAFTLGAEPILFFRRQVVVALMGFDHSLGTGAQTRWGAGEGTDLCARALLMGQRLYIEPSLQVHHELPFLHPEDNRQIEKVRGYARGMGAVLRKNRLPILFVMAYLFTYARALIWSIFKGQWIYVRYHWVRLEAAIDGWRAYPVNQKTC
jgi:glycosyltransferase involved in cell wall biosynthesis